MPFDPPIDIASLPPPVQRVIGAGAPPPMRMMAARGAVPGLRPEQILTAIAFLALEELAHVEPAAKQAAQATFAKLPPPLLAGGLTSPDLPAGIIDALSGYYLEDAAVVEKIVIHPAVATTTMLKLAKGGNEAVTELVAVNEERLLAFPTIIDALYMNKRTRMSTADRVLDLAVRNGKQLSIPAFREAAEAIKDELIAAPDAEPTPDDLLFIEAQKHAALLDGVEVIKEDEEGQEIIEEKALPLEQRLREMTVSQKIRTAMLGTASCRALLIRDKNRLVAQAVVRSPLVQEQEVAAFAMSRAVSEDVLRTIAANGEFTKSAIIKFNLVGNPKTPMATAMRLLPYLRTDELKKLSKSKNVSGQIAKLARQELAKKKPGER